LAVWHRHVDDDLDESIPAVEDVVTRGELKDMRRLAKRIAADPYGKIAEALECVLKAVPEELGSYGVVWARFLSRARAKASHAPT
jgi:hypothetical protein